MKDNRSTPEFMEKVKKVKSAEELQAAVKEFGMELTEEQAKACFDRLHAEGEVADEELNSVVGGGCAAPPTCPQCGSQNVSMAGTQDYPLIQCNDCGYDNKSSVV